MGLHHLRFIKCNFIENWYQFIGLVQQSLTPHFSVWDRVHPAGVSPTDRGDRRFCLDPQSPNPNPRSKLLKFGFVEQPFIYVHSAITWIISRCFPSTVYRPPPFLTPKICYPSKCPDSSPSLKYISDHWGGLTIG
jgi:hypothetical protein